MPIDTTGAQLPTQNTGSTGGGWWPKLVEGLSGMRISFTSGPNGYQFGATGGGQNALPLPPSTQDVNNWLPYLVGGAILFKLLK